MNKVETVITVDGIDYGIEGFGQQVITDALNAFKGKVVKLKGFLINGVFKPVDLSSHWERTLIFKNSKN